MPSTLPYNSWDMHRRFIDWAKQHGHNPATGADTFVRLQSDFDMDQAARGLRLPPEVDARAALRQDLAALAKLSDVAVQFPPIYVHTGGDGSIYRYSLMLVIAEDCVEWIGRVWRELDYQGILTGRGHGPRANYTRLARMAIEHELDQESPGYAKA